MWSMATARRGRMAAVCAAVVLGVSVAAWAQQLTYEGDVIGVDSNARTFTVKGSKPGEVLEMKFHVASTSAIVMEGRPSLFGELVKGDHVTVSYGSVGATHTVRRAERIRSAPRDKRRARVVRLDLKSSAMVILAGNTMNSTRLALNSFPRPAALNRNGELMGRNLMYHVRSNYTWRIKRSALNLPGPDPANIKTAALHLTGSTITTGNGVGQFHFQLYAAPNMDVPMFPGASRDPERFLYLMAPNTEDIESIAEAQNGLGNDRVAIGIRTVGETFGDRTSPIGTNINTSWMNVNPFGGSGDDIYIENGNEYRVPKTYVNLAKTSDDDEVWTAQDKAALDFINELTNQAQAGTGGDPPSIAQPATLNEVIAQIPVNVIPNNSFRIENTSSGRLFVGRFGGQFRVLDAACTHEGCFVNWNDVGAGAEGFFTCPCHTARFAADGTNISGPPPTPLHKPGFRVQGGNLEILIPQSAASPVEFVGGGRDGIGTTYHEAGTLWMGTDFNKSVTDANGRFHHIANAYCIDQSIFPTPAACPRPTSCAGDARD